MPKRKPSLHQLKQVPGYEYVTFEPAIVPASDLKILELPPDDVPDDVVDGRLNHSPRQITKENVTDALNSFLSKKSFLSRQSLKNLSILGVVNHPVLHYNLQTFTEKRFIKWAFEPAPKDSSLTSETTVPNPWQVEISNTFSGHLREGEFNVELPNSAQLGVCHSCVGIGRVRCEDCKGEGGSKCLTCRGSGTVRSGWGEIKCKKCNGCSRTRCNECKGHGQVECDDCKKKSRLKYFMNLTVHRAKTTSHEFSLQLDLPDRLLIAAEGHVIRETTGKRVLPVCDYSDEFVVLASERIIKEHMNNTTTNEIIINQRQQLRSIPVAKVQYSRGQKSGQFYVYGVDNKVYIPRSKKQPHLSCNVM